VLDGSAKTRYQIDDLVLDTGRRSVCRDSEALKIGGLTFDLLHALAEAAPSMLSYDELAEIVWKGRTVAPETIAQRAKMLRDALGDDAKAPRYVESVRGEGYRLLPQVASNASDESAERSYSPKLRGVLALVLAAAFIAAFLFTDHDPPASVAVLPLADMSPNGDQQYLGDGFAEEIINRLATLDGLEVTSRSESFAFRGDSADLGEVGRRLKVSAVLEGSLRRTGDDLRVTMQLIDTQRGYHLWSDQYDLELGDIFQVQDDVASAVAGALGVRLGVGDVNQFFGAGTEYFEAYEAYLQGDFDRAIEIDPNYAAAWGARGVAIASTMWRNRPEDAPAIVERAKASIEKALELNPQSLQAHANYGTLVYVRREWIEAEKAFERSLALARVEYNLGNYANLLMRSGRSRRALAVRKELESMRRIDQPPHLLSINVHIATGDLEYAEMTAARLEDGGFTQLTVALNRGSVADIQRVIDALPPSSLAAAELFRPIRDLLDSPIEAKAFLQRLLADDERFWPSKYENIALTAAFLGYPELALDAFMHELPYTMVRYGSLWYPVMADVRKLPAFHDFVEEVKLVDYWREYGWSDVCRPIGETEFACE